MLAADLTSFQNFQGGIEGASQAITASLTGETEKMKALGVVIRQGTTEYKNNVKALMETRNLTELQAKATENLRIITVQSKNSIGDYAKTSKQLANQMKLTGKIWDDLRVGIGKFLKEFTGFESLTLSFNNNFRKMTDTVLGTLSNWRANWGIFVKWLSKNFITIFSEDIPNVIASVFKGIVHNASVMFKTILDIGSTAMGFFGVDLGNTVIESIINAMKKVGSIFKETFKAIKADVKDVLTGGTGSSLAGVLEGIITGKLGKKGGAEFGELAVAQIQKNFKKLDLTFGLGDFESKTTDLKLITDIPKQIAKAGKDLAKEAGITTEGKPSQKRQTTMAVAAEIGTVEAFRLQSQNEGNKTEKKIERYTKQTADNTKNAAVTINNVSIP
jgi:hypothetical protein